MGFHVTDDFPVICRIARVYKRNAHRAVSLVRNSDHLNRPDAGTAGNHAVEVLGRNVFTVDLVLVADAPRIDEIPVFCNPAEVARSEPAVVSKACGVGFGIFVVSRRHSDTPAADFARFAGRQLSACSGFADLYAQKPAAKFWHSQRAGIFDLAVK